MTLEQPLILLGIGIGFVAVWVWSRITGGAGDAVDLNVEHRIVQLRWTWRRATIMVPPILRWTGVALLVLAAARPYDWRAVGMADVEGVAIQLVIDRSGSMLSDDYFIGSQRVSRLQAAVTAASDFIIGGEEVGSRANDMIGLVAFARFVDRACPLTLDHEQIVARLEQLRVAQDYRDDGTAIGDAVSFAVAELQSLQSSLPSDASDQDLARVVVLLTDGQENAGEIGLATAMELAALYGVRVYVIGLEPEFASAAATSERLQAERSQLGQWASATGGKLYAAGDSQTLAGVYQEINDLERRGVGQQPLRVRRHWAVAWFEIGRWQIPPLILLALLCLLIEGVLRRTVYLQPLTQSPRRLFGGERS